MEQSSINKNETMSKPKIIQNENHLSPIEWVINIIITLAYFIIIIYYLDKKINYHFNLIKFAIFAHIILIPFIIAFFAVKSDPKYVFIKFLVSAGIIIGLYEITPPYGLPPPPPPKY